MHDSELLHFNPMILILQFQTVPSDPVEAEKLELMKMRTLERRAKMSELQRLRKAQVGVPVLRARLCFMVFRRL